jgi:hypothetical protein
MPSLNGTLTGDSMALSSVYVQDELYMSAADHPENVAVMEHLSLQSCLPLRDFCAKFRSVLRLPAFQFGSENETEWGLTEFNDVEYNVSKPYKAGTLREWDNTVPSGCNFGISLVLLVSHKLPTHEWALEHLVVPVGCSLANEFSTTVYFHRTWLGPGRNIARNTHFSCNGAS